MDTALELYPLSSKWHCLAARQTETNVGSFAVDRECFLAGEALLTMEFCMEAPMPVPVWMGTRWLSAKMVLSWSPESSQGEFSEELLATSSMEGSSRLNQVVSMGVRVHPLLLLLDPASRT